MHRITSPLIVATLMVLALATSLGGAGVPSADSPLAATWKAHGGLDAWRSQRTMTYELRGFPLSPQVAKPNRSIVDLHRRFNRIEGDGFTVGWNGREAWAVPDADAIGLPPRFFTLGSFYFIGMPFVFADDGVILHDEGQRTIRDRTYRVVSVGYVRGTGHSSDDEYRLYIDPGTNRLAMIDHSVSETGVERVTWIFDRWQESDGLLAPARMLFHAGDAEADADPVAFTIEDLRFDTKAPDGRLYAAPELERSVRPAGFDPAGLIGRSATQTAP